MSPRNLLALRLLSLLCILCVDSSRGIKVEEILTMSDFYQTLEPNGEILYQLNDDEIFHVDFNRKEAKWGLPQFGELVGASIDGELQNINVLKFNLDIYEKRSNYSKAKSVAQDDIHVFTEKPVVLGEPASLVCLATKFFPPVIKMSWMKNKEPVTDGVSETIYYPAQDGSFSKFLYLSTIPREGDVYTCSVEHDGLSKHPTNRFWFAEAPKQVSSITANVVCGLGLVFGIIGIVAGIALICKGKKNMNPERRH